MNTDDFNRALKIGRHYFEMRGTGDYWTIRALGDYVMKVFAEGESRPLVVANRAIARLESQLELEQRLRQAEASAILRNVC